MQEKHVFNPKLLSQNGNYISYKTDWYGDSLNFFNELGIELVNFLKNNNIYFQEDSISIHKAKGDSRKDCITVRIQSIYTDLPYDGNSID